MPTPAILSNSDAKTSLRAMMVPNNYRKSYEERLNVSRKLFNLSRKRVENLKKNQYAKRFRKIEKPIDDAWVTSGRIGSRDAVLVFRTNPLNTKLKSTEFLKNSSSVPLTSESVTNENICDNIISDNHSSSCDFIFKNSANPESSIEFKSKNVSLKEKTDDSNSSLSSSEHSISSYVNPIDLDPNNSENSQIEACAKDDNMQSDEMEGSDEQANEFNYNENAEDESDEAADDADNCPYSNTMPAIKLKITYKFMQTETKLLRRIFVRHGLNEAEPNENYCILWTGIHMKPDILRNLAPYQRVNHFPRSYELTRKDRLYKNIEKMQHLRGMKHFDIIPQSFILPIEYRDLVTSHNKQRGPWIVKPAASSRGRGIFIVNAPDQIPQEEQVLVSKYIADPLCIDGHKCDLRVYVLVTSFDPLIIYMFEEGLVRLATVKYDRKADNLWNPCMHLCNYSINKYHSDYIKSNDAHNEDVGHKWTLSALLRHLKSQRCDIEQLMINIEDLIIKSIFCCAQSIVSACRMFVPSGNNCFELYGFDILIDDTLKPWLLEVNLSPSMGVDSPIDTKVKSCLVTDLLTCVGIPAYTTTMRENVDSKWTRFRNFSTSRRTTSAELSSIANGGKLKKRNNSLGHINSPPLTLEEQRIILNARLQNARRGRFVRIYPAEDSMQRYGAYLDSTTGIPMSTPIVQGSMSYIMTLPHNYNQVLFNNLYGRDSKDRGINEENSIAERMHQYERALESESKISFRSKPIEVKSEEECKLLRRQILKLIDNGSELTQLQARQLFSSYLESILRRLIQEPRYNHENILLKFLSRVNGAPRPTVFFRNPETTRVVSKSRTAMVAKLLGDFLEQYNRDTEAYIDSFDHYGMIPRTLFNKYLSQAQEADFESVLALHTNLTGNMLYLYNRCGISVPSTPPIRSGLYGFLKALPAMVISGSGAREFNKYDGYFRYNEKDIICMRNDKISNEQTRKHKKKI